LTQPENSGDLAQPEQSRIGARVRAARERLGWTREALAFHSKISWSSVAQIESGRRRNLRPGTLMALARALRVTVDYLICGGPGSPAMLEHRVLLYDTDDEFLDVAGPFLAAGIERSEASLAVTSRTNIDLLSDHLGAEAGAVEFADAATWYSSPGAALDAYKDFANVKLAAGAPWVRVLGEPGRAWSGASDSEIRLWTRYESLVNLVFAAWPVTLLCAYDAKSVAPEIASHARVTHPHTIGPGAGTDPPAYIDPGEFVLEASS
jgi:transcriptional regulator with XRE-family HTH domain